MNRIHESPGSEADARIFVTAAARHLLTPSAVSKAISRLENSLGVRLLARHPRLRVEMKTLVRLSGFMDAGVDCAIADPMRGQPLSTSCGPDIY